MQGVNKMAAAALKVLKGLKKIGKIIRSCKKDENGNRKILNIIIVVVFLLFFFLLGSISPFGLLGKTQKSGVKATSFEDSEIYSNINDTYIEYSNQLEKKIKKRKKKVRKEYSYTETITETNKKGEKTEKKVTIYPEVVVTSNPENLPKSFVYAYITTKYVDVNSWDYDEDEILQFIQDNTNYKEEIISSNKDTVQLIVTLTVKNQEEIAENYFKDSQKDAYALSCKAFSEYDITFEEGSYANINLDELTFYENGMKIPHYLQYDKKWGARKYGTGSISSSGCGPTCMAMVISYLTDTVVTPDMTADWSMGNGYYVPGKGTSWNFYSGAATHWNLNSQNIGKDYKKVVKALSNGNPVIASMSPGTFTKAGHFIVLRGVTSTGAIVVNDPNDNYRTKNFYNREFSLDLIVNESKNFWIITKT